MSKPIAAERVADLYAETRGTGPSTLTSGELRELLRGYHRHTVLEQFLGCEGEHQPNQHGVCTACGALGVGDYWEPPNSDLRLKATSTPTGLVRKGSSRT